MNQCPIRKQCSHFDVEHLTYLHSLCSPEAVVWGNADGSRNDHVWCSRTDKLNQTVDRLKSFFPLVLEMQFDDFEHLYDWVYDNLMKGIWKSARVLHYDIALRIAANHKDAERLLPSAFLYLHGKPWRTSKALDAKLKVREYRKPSTYLDHIFDCGHCNPRIKEHALCHYHEAFVELARKMKEDGK